MARRTAAPPGVSPGRRRPQRAHPRAASTTPPPPLAAAVDAQPDDVACHGASSTTAAPPRRRRCHLPLGAAGVVVAVLAVVALQLLTMPVAANKSHLVEKPAKVLDNPKFHAPIVNETAPLGREAILTCLVDDLGIYKVAWLRVDTQTILTIANHVITKNHRIGVSYADQRTWKVHIKDVRETDRGWYMCQINTDPMKSQQGYLDVVVPPDILDYPTSTDMVVREFSNVTLRCAANGSPRPNITWRREYGALLQLPDGREALTAEGENYTIARVTREHMGAYLCIASNGVPPSISKRIGLTVEFPPAIEVPKQLVGARLGRPLVLQCTSQAFPKSHNYWVRADNMLVQGPGYETEMVETSYSISMRLTIESVTHYDFGEYKCVSKNYLGETEQTIKVEHVKSQDSGWGPAATKLPKHSKGKYLGRPVSENSIEIPDAEESTSASSPASSATANVFLAVATLIGALSHISRTIL